MAIELLDKVLYSASLGSRLENIWEVTQFDII